jgi:hypothetical protein
MAHSFVAYIDESGDEGFTFADPPDRKSSEWFVLGATVIRATQLEASLRSISAEFSRLEEQRRNPILHLSSIQHEARVALLHKIGTTPGRSLAVCIHKKALDHPENFKGTRRLYFYGTRYLVERISWLVRDSSLAGEGDGRCKLVFSRCRGLSYEELADYLATLRVDKSGKVQVFWNAIDHDRIEVFEHRRKVGLKIADAISSGVRMGLEITPHGFCEDRYVRLLRRTIYSRTNFFGKRNYLSYGLKFLPFDPAPEPPRDNRYAWIQKFK